MRIRHFASAARRALLRTVPKSLPGNWIAEQEPVCGKDHAASRVREIAMELHQIRYFLALSEELNFTRAAQRCRVAQSSLTRAIRALESELGGALFHRERANSHLSRLGQTVHPLLVQAYSQVEGAKRQARAFLRRETRTLRLGVMRTIAPQRAVALIDMLQGDGVAPLQAVSDAGAALQERLHAGELDAA